MRSSWGCCWLFLSWALLLGHPASGQEEGYQVALLEEPDDPVEVGQPEEPEDLLEPEEAVMEQDESEEPEDLLEPEEMMEPSNDEIDRYIERELEFTALINRYNLKMRKHVGFYKDMALKFMELNKHDEDPYADPNAVYRHMEDSSITVQKAFGNIIKFRMFLTKGDCKNYRVDNDVYLHYLLSQRHQDPTTCQKLDCVFTVFQDVRTHHEAVINSDCHPLVLAEEMQWRSPPHEDHAILYDDDYTNSYVSEDHAILYDDDYTNSYVSDTPDVPASDDDTLEVPNDLPISDYDSPYAPTSNVDTPDTPASDGDNPDVPTSDDDANEPFY